MEFNLGGAGYDENDCDYIKVKAEAIPMCNECLVEIKDGNFICQNCKMNICEIH